MTYIKSFNHHNHSEKDNNIITYTSQIKNRATVPTHLQNSVQVFSSPKPLRHLYLKQQFFKHSFKQLKSFLQKKICTKKVKNTYVRKKQGCSLTSYAGVSGDLCGRWHLSRMGRRSVKCVSGRRKCHTEAWRQRHAIPFEETSQMLHWATGRPERSEVRGNRSWKGTDPGRLVLQAPEIVSGMEYCVLVVFSDSALGMESCGKEQRKLAKKQRSSCNAGQA